MEITDKKSVLNIVLLYCDNNLSHNRELESFEDRIRDFFHAKTGIKANTIRHLRDFYPRVAFKSIEKHATPNQANFIPNRVPYIEFCTPSHEEPMVQRKSF